MNNQQIHLCPNCKSAHVAWWDAEGPTGSTVLAFYCHACRWTGVIPRVVPMFHLTLAPEDPMKLERDYLERCYALELSR